MWITLAQNTASSPAGPLPACISGHHAGSERSIRNGGRIFGNPACARHALMLFKCCSLRSLGHQVISGLRPAKSTTCWPVPLPASITSPDLPARNGCITAQIARWLRVKRRRVEATVGQDRPAILAEFHDIFSHDILPDLLAGWAYRFKPRRREPQKTRQASGRIVEPFDLFRVRRENTLRSPPRSRRLRCQPMAFML